MFYIIKHKIRAFIKDKKGNSFTLGLTLCIAIVFVAYCLFSYYGAVANIQRVQDSSQLALDAYTVQTGREIVSQIKSGNYYTKQLNSARFIKNLYTTLGIDSDLNGWYNNGNLRYSISNTSTEFVLDETLRTKVTFTMTLPFYFFNQQIFTRDIHIKILSHYNMK